MMAAFSEALGTVSFMLLFVLFLWELDERRAHHQWPYNKRGQR